MAAISIAPSRTVQPPLPAAGHRDLRMFALTYLGGFVFFFALLG